MVNLLVVEIETELTGANLNTLKLFASFVHLHLDISLYECAVYARNGVTAV